MAKSKNRSSNSAHTARAASASRGQHHGASDDYAAPRRHNESDEFGGAIKLAFRDHNWPASRKALLEHARHNTALGKNEIARLEQIPDRKYKSVVDLMNATRETQQPRSGQQHQQQPQRQEVAVGQVTGPEANRRAAGEMQRDHAPQYQNQYQNQNEYQDEYRGSER